MNECDLSFSVFSFVFFPHIDSSLEETRVETEPEEISIVKQQVNVCHLDYQLHVCVGEIPTTIIISRVMETLLSNV